VKINSASREHTLRSVGVAFIAIGSLACSAEPAGERPGGYSAAGTSGADAVTTAGTGGSSNVEVTSDTASATNTSAGSGGSMNVPLPMDTDPAALIPARIRRLTNAEYDASAAQLVGTTQQLAQDFAPDARQQGFTVNDAQRVDSVLVKQLFAAAETLAAEARPRFAELAPCDTPETPEACASQFIESFGSQAYRRPLSTEESAGLLEVYRVGADGTSYEDGIELVIRALLQSAGFLYLTELGGGAADENGAVTLTPHELASSLSYLVTGAPPDQALLDAVTDGRLATPEGRVAELLRLRSEAEALSDTRLVRLLREWLAIDRIETTAKDTNIYPAFDGVKPAVASESHAFLNAVLDENSGSLSALLSADVSADNALASVDSASGALPTRLGVLNQGAFLAVHAHAHESTPVLRGVAIGRRIACFDIQTPASLNITVSPPIPDPSLTTRERFAVHSTDPGCASCHVAIDPLGNAFEQFDGMGAYRTLENGKNVDSSTSISLGTDFDGSYADSNELALALAASQQVRDCFARQLFRAAAARTDDTTKAAEDAFVAELKALPEAQQGNVIDTLIQFVSGPVFTHRRTL
jgi:hypothetical protein